MELATTGQLNFEDKDTLEFLGCLQKLNIYPQIQPSYLATSLKAYTGSSPFKFIHQFLMIFEIISSKISHPPQKMHNYQIKKIIL